jgi:hypothetical protein
MKCESLIILFSSHNISKNLSIKVDVFNVNLKTNILSFRQNYTRGHLSYLFVTL